MTENKRFTFTQDTLAKADVFDGDEFVCCTLSVWVEQLVDLLNELAEENKELKASLYAEKTNTAEVVNDYAKQFKRHSAQFSFMIDLAEDLGVDIKSLEASDD